MKTEVKAISEITHWKSILKAGTVVKSIMNEMKAVMKTVSEMKSVTKIIAGMKIVMEIETVTEISRLKSYYDD